MAEDYSLFDYPSEREDDRQPLWKPEKSKPEPNACIVSGAPAPTGSCEFVGGVCYEGALVGSVLLAAFVFCLLILQRTLLARLELRN